MKEISEFINVCLIPLINNLWDYNPLQDLLNYLYCVPRFVLICKVVKKIVVLLNMERSVIF